MCVFNPKDHDIMKDFILPSQLTPTPASHAASELKLWPMAQTDLASRASSY